MTRAPRTHYLNAEFDLSLRPRAGWTRRPSLVRQVRELSTQALLGAEEEDVALVRVPVPDEFPAYLRRRGIPVPRIRPYPGIDPDTVLRPFGWSEEARERNRRHLRPAPHPAPEVIEKVNARSFARELEARIFPGAPAGSVLEDLPSLERFLARANPGSAWILKSEHGNAGLANRRVGAPALSEADRRFVTGALAEDDRLVAEPWLSRERDWCLCFIVPFAPDSFRMHEMHNTRVGSLIGVRFAPGRTDRWREAAGAAERVASALEEEGYFGPVCMDAFTWRDGDRTRFRPLVDLNCRRSMSDGAYRLWRRIAPGRTFLYRFFSLRKLTLPCELESAAAALGEYAYDPARRRGILLASPLSHGPGPRPGKLAMIFAAADGPGAAFLERWFRSRFEV